MKEGKELWEEHTQSEKNFWKRHISGLESLNKIIRYEGEFYQNRPVFRSDLFKSSGIFVDDFCPKHAMTGVTFFVTKSDIFVDLVGGKTSFCRQIGEINDFKKEIRKIIWEKSFFKPFPYKSISNIIKKWLHILIMCGKRSELPLEVVLHICGFLRMVEIKIISQYQ